LKIQEGHGLPDSATNAHVYNVLYFDDKNFQVFDNAVSSGKLTGEIRDEIFISTRGLLRVHFRTDDQTEVEDFYAVARGILKQLETKYKTKKQLTSNKKMLQFDKHNN